MQTPERPPATVEAAPYFVVCEALANAAKHSGARRVTVDVRRDGDDCVVTVTVPAAPIRKRSTDGPVRLRPAEWADRSGELLENH